MKYLLFLGVPLALLLNSCTKDKYMSKAVITGFDDRMCICCGGLMINFEGETTPYQGDFYNLTNSPAELGIDSTTVFPMHIKADWIKTNNCNGRVIKITRFESL